jgi:hypothetical protein
MANTLLKIALGMAALALSACGPGPEAIATAKPATGPALVAYSKDITQKIDLGKNADLVQYFCSSSMQQPCPADIVARLKDYGFTSESDGVDLAYRFTLMAADAKDGSADKTTSDEDFFVAAYKTVLGREPDTEGAKANLALIKDSGQRKTVLRGMLQSREFQSR